MNAHKIAGHIKALDSVRGIIGVDNSYGRIDERCQIHMSSTIFMRTFKDNMEEPTVTEFDDKMDKISFIVDGVEFFCLADKEAK